MSKTLQLSTENRAIEAHAGFQSPIPEELDRIEEVSQRVALCTSSIYRLIKLGKFPRPYEIAERAVRFRR